MIREYTISKTEYYQFLKNDLIKYLKNSTLFLVLVSVAIAMMWFEDKNLLFVSSMTFSVIVVLILLYYLYNFFRVKWIIDNSKLHKFQLTPQGFYIGPKHKDLIKLDSVRSIEVTNPFIIINISRQSKFLIPINQIYPETDTAQFISKIQEKLKDRHQIRKETKDAPYLVGLICFIPGFGVLAGLVIMYLASNYFYNNKFLWIGLIGTIFSYFSLFIIFHFLPSDHDEIISEHRQNSINRLIPQIEYYHLIYDKYPDSLGEIEKYHSCYYMKNDSDKYLLVDIGDDTTLNTADDILPQICPEEVEKIGAIKFTMVYDSSLCKF